MSFVHHTVYVTGSDVVMCLHFVWLCLKAWKCTSETLDDIMNILSQLDVDL